MNMDEINSILRTILSPDDPNGLVTVAPKSVNELLDEKIKPSTFVSNILGLQAVQDEVINVDSTLTLNGVSLVSESELNVAPVTLSNAGADTSPILDAEPKTRSGAGSQSHSAGKEPATKPESALNRKTPESASKQRTPEKPASAVAVNSEVPLASAT